MRLLRVPWGSPVGIRRRAEGIQTIRFASRRRNDGALAEGGIRGERLPLPPHFRVVKELGALS
jgi:hypothetical protein